MPGRGHVVWLDWLKVLLVAGICYFHATQPFVVSSWLISNDERSAILSAFAGIGYLFGIPLLFLAAGAASRLAVERRTVGHFTLRRLRRLLPPLAMGLLVLSPFQWWLAMARDGSVGLPDAYARFVVDVQLEASPRWLATYGYHLWFIGFLIAYSLLALPLLAWLRGASGRTAVERLGAHMNSVLAAVVLFVSLVAVQVLLRPSFPRQYDWADFAVGLVAFGFGMLVAADPRLPATVARGYRRLLVAAVVLTVALVPAHLAGRLQELEFAPTYAADALAYLTVRTAATSCWVLGSLGFAIRHLTRPARGLDYAAEVAFPFFVIHHPTVVLLAAAVIPWATSLWLKHAVVTLGSLAATLVLLELVVRPVPPLRALFGLKARQERDPSEPMSTPDAAHAPLAP
jgi:acyltransferase-like protein